MQSIQTVSENTIYVGASDRRLAKFENLFPIPRGVSYNAYVILDEKTALLDTADASVGAQFLENVAAALDGRKLDYLIVDHMEPDHGANIARRHDRSRVGALAGSAPGGERQNPAHAENVLSHGQRRH